MDKRSELEMSMDLVILFVGIVIGLVSGLLAGLNVATDSFKDLAYKIESVKVYENKCRYEVKWFKFNAECGKFNVGDIVEFRKVGK